VDIALHCNGDLAEAQAVAAASPALAGESLARAERAALKRFAALAAAIDFDPVEAWAEIAVALAIAT
jgi:beta-N-acetylhexosaminidase